MADKKHRSMATGPEPKRRKGSSSPSTPTKGSTIVSHSESRKTEGSSLPSPSSRRFEPHTIDSKRPATDLDQAILAEGRGQIRTNFPYDEFCKSFSSRLRDLSEELQDSQVEFFRRRLFEGGVNKEAWEEETFHDTILSPSMADLLQSLSTDLRFVYNKRRPLDRSKMSGLSQDGVPDSLIAKGPKPEKAEHWKAVELVIEHTKTASKDSLQEKFTQWLRYAWMLFDEQPHRRFCFGILFLRPHAFLCYADHGCAAASEPLDVTENPEHVKRLVRFLISFLKSDESQRGKDPDISESNGITKLSQGDQCWTVKESLFHRANVVGRNILVFSVSRGDGEEAKDMICKSVWEAISTDASDLNGPLHTSEREVIRHLIEAKVRGLPAVENIELAKITSPYAETAALSKKGVSFREDIHQSTLTNTTNAKVSTPTSSNYLISKQSKHATRFPGTSRQHFVSPTDGRRQLYRIIMSQCQPLKVAVKNDGFEVLMPIIRDAMICYYECYKIPNPGWLQADISVENIMATTSKTILTGSSEKPSRKGTIIDWNYSYPVSGGPTSRHIRSGTPAFMALDLLDKWSDSVHRTVGHDLESFFAVILYVAVRHENEEWKEQPWGRGILYTDLEAIYNAKKLITGDKITFQKRLLNHLSPKIPDPKRFNELLENIRSVLYPAMEISDNEEITRIYEDFFKRIMRFIDNFLDDGHEDGDGDGHGITSLKEIDERKRKSQA